MATGKEWAGVIAKLQLVMGQIQCVELCLTKEWPDKTPYRTWWAVVFAIDGNDAMARLKHQVHTHAPVLIPYIRDWDRYAPYVK